VFVAQNVKYIDPEHERSSGPEVFVGNWNFRSELADFRRMPVDGSPPNEFRLKSALMGPLFLKDLARSLQPQPENDR